MRSFRSKPVGWRHESYRHYLAAKGVKSAYAAKTALGRGLERIFEGRERQVRSASPAKVLEQAAIARQVARYDVSLQGVGIDPMTMAKLRQGELSKQEFENLVRAGKLSEEDVKRAKIFEEIRKLKEKQELSESERKKLGILEQEGEERFRSLEEGVRGMREKVLRTGLRPEEELQKKGLLKGLGIGAPTKPNVFELAAQWGDEHWKHALGKLQDERFAQTVVISEAIDSLKDTTLRQEVVEAIQSQKRVAEARQKMYDDRIKRIENMVEKFEAGIKFSDEDRREAARQVREFSWDRYEGGIDE